MPSPTVALEAAVGPAPAEPTSATADPAATSDVALPVVADELDQPAGPAGSDPTPPEPETTGDADEGLTVDPDAGQTGDVLADQPAAEAEPSPAKPWWNPTGGGSDEPDRGDDTPT